VISHLRTLTLESWADHAEHELAMRYGHRDTDFSEDGLLPPSQRFRETHHAPAITDSSLMAGASVPTFNDLEER
jgi:hypothetical protein